MRRPSKYSEEFRADAVALARSTEIGITQAARDLGVSPETLRNGVKQAKVDPGLGSVGALTTAEREEFTRRAGGLLSLVAAD